MTNPPELAVRSAAKLAARKTDGPLLLAVSGGLDSMVLLSAMHEAARGRIAGVATFDHDTGRAATIAVRLVRRIAADLGLPVASGRASGPTAVPDGREAAWRKQRWSFLRDAADRLRARVVTAHTESDQIETVLMRAMRGSGARGLAGLYSDSAVVRPFLALRRDAIAAYAASAGVEWVDDPSNLSRDYFRNRVRHDLLPAMRIADPVIDLSLLDLARRSALLRGDVDAFIDRHVRPEVAADGHVVVASSQLSAYDRSSLALLWIALAGRAGLALDRRGTRRLAEFTNRQPRAGGIPLAGGWCLEATRDSYVLGRVNPLPPPVASLPTEGTLEWGRFRFRVGEGELPASPWTAVIVARRDGVIRAWNAGDRLAPAAGQPRRRVTRYLSDVGLQGGDRAGWPVVVAGDDVVWIPGVRRSDAATDRSGRPVRHYVCERIDR